MNRTNRRQDLDWRSPKGLIVPLLALFCCLPSVVFGQVATGIVGVVEDASGSMVPNTVMVTLLLPA